MNRRSFMRAVTGLAGLLGLGRAKAEPGNVNGERRIWLSVTDEMDDRLSIADEEGRTPLSFSLGSEALKEWDEAALEIVTWTEDQGCAGDEPHRLERPSGRIDRRYRGIPVEPDRPAGLAMNNGSFIQTDFSWRDPSLVQLHTASATITCRAGENPHAKTRPWPQAITDFWAEQDAMERAR